MLKLMLTLSLHIGSSDNIQYHCQVLCNL